MSEAQAGVARAAPTGVHWHGPGWYAARLIRGIEMYYYLAPSRGTTLDEARAKATERSMGEPMQFMTKDGFDYAY